ncbi:MAG: ABC transporter substrate-binding protein [Armatimonadetes bacterium]|nr:ABC transporter substrate-binding protein [Armatimonadota bacterium]
MPRKREGYVRALLAAAVVFGLWGCSKPQPAETPPVSPQPKASTTAKRLRIAVVPKGTVHDFWLTVKAGADAAGEGANAEILWKGPSEETDVAGQIAMIEDFINQKVDAIVMAACDAKGLKPTVQKAMDAKIPVVTIDSGVEPDISLCFVATDNIAGAREAARTLCKLIGEKGKVGLIPFVPGAATSQMREAGFKDELKNHPNVKLVKTLYSQSDVSKGMTAAEDMLTSDPDIAGIFAANESGAMGAAQALKQKGVAGKVKLVAFDASQAEIDALKDGTIQALIVQDPYKMGSEGVRMAVRAINGETIPKRVDTGVTAVTKDNLNNPDIQQILNPLGNKK